MTGRDSRQEAAGAAVQDRDSAQVSVVVATPDAYRDSPLFGASGSSQPPSGGHAVDGLDSYGGALLRHHAAMLAASGISPEHARARRYRSIDTKVGLARYKVAAAGQRVPGLLVPMLRVDGSEWGYQYRPDSPRERGGKPVKYETPPGQRNGIDFPPGVRDKLANLEQPLWITEGVKKADSAVQRGLACIALPGVWSWKGKPGNDPHESPVAVGDWDDVGIKRRGIVIAFDSDVMVKPSVRTALERLARFLDARGAAEVRYLVLPDDVDSKTGLDDFLAEHRRERAGTVRPEGDACAGSRAGARGPEGRACRRNGDPAFAGHPRRVPRRVQEVDGTGIRPRCPRCGPHRRRDRTTRW